MRLSLRQRHVLRWPQGSVRRSEFSARKPEAESSSSETTLMVGSRRMSTDSAEEPPFEPLLCSSCFHDYGLALDAHTIGVASDAACRHCSRTDGRKLDKDRLLWLAEVFFVRGTLVGLSTAPLLSSSSTNTII